MTFLLCSGRRKFIDLIQIPISLQLYHYFIGQVLTVLFFYLYYLYCLSIFQRTCCFRFKSGCKGKGFIFNYQTFSEVFFYFSFYSFLRLSMRKGKNVLKKNKGRFLCESDCKDKNFIYYPPKLFGSFLFFSLSAISLFTMSILQGFLLLESGCKSTPFWYTIQIY